MELDYPRVRPSVVEEVLSTRRVLRFATRLEARINGELLVAVRPSEAPRTTDDYDADLLALDITDTTLTISRDTDRIDAEAALDGIYVLRTTATPTEFSTDAVIGAYKNLAQVERDFRSLKAIDLDLRPIHHRLDDRVKAHVLICMLAAYLTWHMRKTLAPLTFTDEHPPARQDPVAPARRSAATATKAARKTTTDTALPARSYQALLTHLGTLTRNDLRY